jgi:hypothetical protein
MLFAHFVRDPGREWKEADMITGPAWALEGRAFGPTGGAARTNAQLIA